MRRILFFAASIVTFVLFSTFCFSEDPDNLVTRYSYDPVGNLAWVHLANGNFTHYTYDALNRLSEQVTYQARPTSENPNPPELSRYSYLYYANGQRAQSVQTQNGVTATYQWKYDGLGRLKEEVLVGVYTHQWT
jgi:YD repeat-containing protein